MFFYQSLLYPVVSIRSKIGLGALLSFFSLVLLFEVPAQVYAASSPVFASRYQNSGFQNLVYGGSTTVDVQNAIGELPDEIVKSEQMYPLIENYYYYDHSGSGAATIFVFENGLLVGMHYKSPTNQMLDLTYFLINNGDREINYPMNAGYRGYYPYFPFYSW